MSTNELESKVRELRQLQSLIEEARAEAETIRDTIKAHMGTQEELRAGEYRVTWRTVKTAPGADTPETARAVETHTIDQQPRPNCTTLGRLRGIRTRFYIRWTCSLGCAKAKY